MAEYCTCTPSGKGKVKVKVSTLDIAPLRGTPPQKRREEAGIR